jgi:hypothetical protein
MLKITALIFTAIVACTAIGTWAAANSRIQGKPRVAVTTTVGPAALTLPSNLPHEQFDAH